MNTKVKCAIYARVSTDRQGDSVENQIGQATEFISRLGDEFELDEDCIFIDNAVSGYYTSVFDRDAMKLAMEMAKQNKYQVLIFKAITRVGRDKQENPAIVGMFEQYGIRVIAMNDNYDTLNRDNITFDILSVLAEKESEKTSVSVSSARRQKALRGEWGGEPPIGYIVENKKLIIDPNMKHIPEKIFDLYVNHGLGTFKVAEHLNSRGILTKNNYDWTREGINRVIRNEAYIGTVVHGKRKNKLERTYDDTGRMTKKKTQVRTHPSEWTIVENAHPAIIDPETFYEAQRILKSRGHHGVARRAYHPLTGILFCGNCGAGMVCQKRSYKEKEYRYYICKTYHKYGRERCEQANINGDELEAAIVDIVKGRLEKISTSNIRASINRDEDINRLRVDEKRLVLIKEKTEKDQVDVFNQRELFSDDVYKEQMINIKNKIGAFNEELEIVRKKIDAIGNQMNKTANIEQVIRQFLILDIKAKDVLRVLLHDLIKKITIKGKHLDIEYHYDLF